MQRGLPPGSVIGIFGSGQLGKMLCIAAAELGYRTLVYSDVEGCALDVATDCIIAPYTNEERLIRFVRSAAVATLEFENIPLETLDIVERLSEGKLKVWPGKIVLAVSRNRLHEKEMAINLGIPTPGFWRIVSEVCDGDMPQPQDYPIILKKAIGGYDGRGQIRVHNKFELMDAWGSFDCVPCIAERVVKFDYEFSIIVARDLARNMKCYMPFKNTHEDGILVRTKWPCHMSGWCADQAYKAAMKIAEHLGVVGLLAVEMFHLPTDAFVFNEIAPRPHNSGHVTIECARTSQFSQHIRAITGMPLGATRPIRNGGVMINLIGDDRLLDEMSEEQHAEGCIHRYNKAPKLGRKIGHVTFHKNIPFQIKT